MVAAESLICDRFMHPTAQPSHRNRQQSSREAFTHSPLLVFYEVTQACDLVCDHCRACAGLEPHRNELTTRQSLELIDQLTEFPSPPTLILTGGDPLKRSDIFELIEYATERRLNVAITPSATPLVTRQAIQRLCRAGISRMAISIDGADARTHDNRRGVVGSFRRSLQILADARAECVPIQVNTTVTPANVQQIDLMAELLAGQRIAMWSVFFLVPVGRAYVAPRLSADQCEAAFERLWIQSQRQVYPIKTTAAPHYRRFVRQRQSAKRKRGGSRSPSHYASLGVNDGNGVMFVSHVGQIYPSGFMPIFCGRFPAAHVVRVYQESPIFRSLRDIERLEGKCNVCEFRNICGGSRARAYAVTGNPYAEEPDCAYIPARVRNK
jgi:AdoMet-dependent heme synthase